MLNQRSVRSNKHGSGQLNAKAVIAVAVIILLFIGIAVLAFSSNGAASITGSQSYIINKGSTLRFYTQNSSIFSMFLGNSSANSASIYLSQYPILTNPITEVTGASGSSFNLSTSGSDMADINLKIISSNGSSAKIQLTSLPSGLSIHSSPLAVIVVPGPLPNGGASIQAATTTITTTTVPPANTTRPANTLQSTTTIAQTSQVPQTIVSLAETTNIGVLMGNLEALYAQEPKCSEATYNQTFETYLHRSPTGPFSFANATADTPTSVNATIRSTSTSGIYLVNYSVSVPTKRLSGTVISFDMDSSGAISNLKFLGIFNGENYTTINEAYQSQSSIGNACAAYVQ